MALDRFRVMPHTNHKFPSALFANIGKTLMIQNMKLGTNNIKEISCVISKCGLMPPFCLVIPVYNVNY